MSDRETPRRAAAAPGTAPALIHGPAPAELQRVAARAVELAGKAGAADAEACVESARAFTITVNGGEIETLKQSATRGLGLRVRVGDAIGFVTSTDVRDETLADLARRAVALARFATPDPCSAFASAAEAEDPEAGDPVDLALYDPAVLEIPAETKIEWALELERLALAFDPRISRVDGATVATQDGASVIVNSRGVSRAWDGTAITAWVAALAADQGDRQQSGVYVVSRRRLSDIPPLSTIATEAARRAVSRIGARPVPAARVPVVLHPDIAASWIGDMHEAFSGEALIKRSSWLTDRLDQVIAAPCVTLVDDGRMPGGIGTEPWDGEGVATRRNVLIDRGRLARFIYDTYHARRANTRSTGSAVRSYAAQPSIGAMNLYLAAGAESPEQILKKVDRGFYMDDQGSYGFNSVTGDYSYQAQGFWIENGEKTRPVDGVTVASNSLEMLKSVVAVGNDLRFDRSVAAPTVLISEMTVSGRDA